MRDSSKKGLTSQEGPAGDEPTWPHPPRYWWLKRLTFASLLLGLVLAGVWAGWAREAGRRLAHELGPIVAAVEPVNAPTMNVVNVPDAENGALLYRKAHLLLNRSVPSPANSQIDYRGYPPFPARWHKLADQAVPANAPALAAFREARDYRRFDWGVRAVSPAYATMLPHVNDAREMANFVGDAALYAHVHGDDAEAVERLRDVLHEARSLATPPSFLITHLVSIGCEAAAVSRVEVIAPGLSIEGGATTPAPAGTPSSGTPPVTRPAPRPSARPATRAQVRALIADLLDEREAEHGLRYANAGERAAQLDMAESFGRKVPVLRPMFELDAVRLVRINEAVIRAGAQPDWPSAKGVIRSAKALQQIPAPQTNFVGTMRGAGGPAGTGAGRQPVDYTRLLTSDVGVITGLPTGRAIEQTMVVRTERRLAAVSLAIQIYRADHGGQFPPSLDALVPDYLPRVPADPLRGDGKPVGYVVARGALPGGGDRPLVYSTGSDGVDDTAARGPAAAGLPAEPLFGTHKDALDQGLDVSRWAPPTPDDEPEQE